MVPFKTVENKRFKRLLKVVDPRYELPSHKYFSSNAFPRLYSECHEKMEQQISERPVFCNNQSSVVQPHFRDLFESDNSLYWQMEALQHVSSINILPRKSHVGTHTQGLRDAFECWGLKEDNMTYMTTDSRTNMVTALELNNWTRLLCFGHGQTCHDWKSVGPRKGHFSGPEGRQEDMALDTTMARSLCSMKSPWRRPWVDWDFTNALSGKDFVSILCQASSAPAEIQSLGTEQWWHWTNKNDKANYPLLVKHMKIPPLMPCLTWFHLLIWGLKPSTLTMTRKREYRPELCLSWSLCWFVHA